MRVLHESYSWEEKMFCTLTYDNDHVDENYSLKKKDLQNFFKRLRKNTQRKIKYFACGEYGELTKRPHYHAILFGIGLNNKNLITENWPYCDWRNNAILKNSFGMVEPYSISYVAQYIDKKLSGEEAEKEYDEKRIEHPFRIVSQGIGLEYAEKNKKQIVDNGCITTNGIKKSIPRYYINKLKLPLDTIKDHAIISEMDLVQEITGLNMTRDLYYKLFNVESNLELEYTIQKKRQQHENNQKGKLRIKSQKKGRDLGWSRPNGN